MILVLTVDIRGVIDENILSSGYGDYIQTSSSISIALVEILVHCILERFTGAV
jgi:hypothetical protein